MAKEKLQWTARDGSPCSLNAKSGHIEFTITPDNANPQKVKDQAASLRVLNMQSGSGWIKRYISIWAAIFAAEEEHLINEGPL